MKVKFIQSGGFAGTVKGCELDAKSLPADAIEQLQDLMDDSGAGSASASSETSRDLHQYEITVQDGRRSASLTFDDGTVPEAVKPLLSFLKKAARPQPLE